MGNPVTLMQPTSVASPKPGNAEGSVYIGKNMKVVAAAKEMDFPSNSKPTVFEGEQGTVIESNIESNGDLVVLWEDEDGSVQGIVPPDDVRVVSA